MVGCVAQANVLETVIVTLSGVFIVDRLEDRHADRTFNTGLRFSGVDELCFQKLEDLETALQKGTLPVLNPDEQRRALEEEIGRIEQAWLLRNISGDIVEALQGIREELIELEAVVRTSGR